MLFVDSHNNNLMAESVFTPPLDRLSKLRFTFRFHDGRLVDFKCLNFITANKQLSLISCKKLVEFEDVDDMVDFSLILM